MAKKATKRRLGTRPSAYDRDAVERGVAYASFGCICRLKAEGHGRTFQLETTADA